MSKGGDNDIPKIGAPAARAIATLGIKKLGEFTRFSESQVLELHGMGPKALGIIKAALKARGLSFKK